MAGIILYIVTLGLELLSVLVRFALVSALVTLIAGGQIGVGVGILAGLAPVIYSLLVLAGIPSGHILIRRNLAARPLTRSEQAQLAAAVAPMQAQGLTFPKHVFALDTEGLNAAISGRTLYIHRDLFASRFLAGVIAHELGHYTSLDGRLMLAIRALTIPGGFVMAGFLLHLLRWLAHAIAWLLGALLTLIFAMLRMNLSWIIGWIFGMSIQIMRMLIIFGVGGVGSALLGSAWRSYFIEREYVADAFAASLGYAYDLIAFFETEVLTDVTIPWYEQPTHPSTTRRIANLEAVAVDSLQLRTLPKSTARAHAAASPLLNQVAPSHTPSYQSWPFIAITIASLVTILLAVFIFTTLHHPRTQDTFQPTPGPTPTLGVPVKG
ncbi:M48 family metalloprotease [Candidatus Oscillochloris fontis]|uniref:M48 family metalloprotease n=1 Tax=Candidatus Oscillochloris fontis TaxID=2496868 RepID=UPI00101D6FC9|nr:M48 family metalloprotease [Candidatus Oscillochloris fontis]